MVLVWTFSGGANPSKQNWAQAILLRGIAAIILAVIPGTASFAFLAGTLGRL